MWPNPQFPADLDTFTEESLNDRCRGIIRTLTKTSQTKNSQIKVLDV